MALVSIAFIVVEWNKKPPTDWRPHFDPHEKSPYGLYIFDHLLPKAFPKQIIEHTSRPMAVELHELNQQKARNTNFVIVNHIADMNANAVNELLQYVENVNNVFISTHELSKDLSDTLKVKVNSFWSAKLILTLDPKAQAKQDSNQVRFKDTTTFSDKGYFFPDYLADHDIIVTNAQVRHDSTHFRRLGMSKAWTNLVEFKRGKGHIYIHTLPFAFTNYCLLDNLKAEYAFKTLSYLPMQKTFVEAYQRGLNEDQSLLRFVMRQDPLRWAYYVLLLGILLFMIFESKRRQRIIPIIKPLENTQLSFVRTVGRLYFHQGNHRNLADKKITYFLENLRTRYGIQTNEISTEFYQHLADKTGKSITEISDLFRTITNIQAKDQISETELHNLNRHIEDF
jgi:hypothetical protein